VSRDWKKTLQKTGAACILGGTAKDIGDGRNPAPPVLYKTEQMMG